MASTGEEENVLQENSGRRTRSGRKVSGSQPVSSPSTRSTRRSKKQEQIIEQEIADADHSSIIQEMLTEAAQGNLGQPAEVHNQTVQEIIGEVVISTEGEECIIYEEQVIEEIYENPHEDNQENIVIHSEANLDEKSSSFPFATDEVVQSETSEDINEQPEEKEEKTETENQGTQENSLLASLAGDNANSLPSVGCGAELEKEQFESKVIDENCEKTEFEDSLSEPAVAEDLPNASGSDDTMVNTEVISEDELPLPTKPEINDAEEVSDEELPAPQRAELPADAEVISEDEFPVNASVVDDPSLREKQKVDLPPDAEVISEDELPTSGGIEEKRDHVDDNENSSNKKRKIALPPDAEVISEDELPAINTAGDKPTSPQSKEVTSKESSSRKKRKAESRAGSTEKNAEEVSSKKDEQYNPMSPTSESDDSAPFEKKIKTEDSDNKEKEKRKDKDKEREKEKEKDTSSSSKDKDKEREKEKERKKLPDLDKFWRAVKEDPADFTGWTYLLQYVDTESDAEAAREAYDAFLSHYPYCYGYWRKYADYEKRKGIKANCNAVFERGLEAIPLSVDLWIHYISHVKSNHGDDEEYIRSQFERAIDACGLEFRSDKLWDAYLKWENEGKRYQNMLKIYDRLIATPTQGYSGHFDNFQDLINQHSITNTITPEEIKKLRLELRETNSSSKSSSSRSKSRRASSKDKDSETNDRGKEKERKEKDNESSKEKDKIKEKSDKASNEEPSNKSDGDVVEAMVVDPVSEEEVNIEKASNDFEDLTNLTEEEMASIKDKVISARRKIHKSTVSAITARWTFEEGIKRPYFHVKPLERCQLKNWRDYLDFEIEKGDRQRILVLFERCLIACALYDEFWLKMIRYLETILDQPGVPAITSDVYRRACEIHHPDKPSLHLMWAAFEECQSNFDRAAEILVNLEKRVPNLLQVAYRRINVERRRGDFDKCKSLYEHYINTAKNKNIAGSLAIKYARFLNKICHDLEGGLKILRQALEKDNANTRVALQMIDLALQRSSVDEDEVVLVMDKFMARENIDPEQKVLFAQRKVEFLEDFGSSAKGLQDAQRALQIALNKANEAKKKRESSPSRKSGHKEASSVASSTQSVYNNGSSSGAASYNYGSGNSAYYAQQNSGGSYPQQQQSYDSYYNHWQYNTGYSGYGQWSGYTNYY